MQSHLLNLVENPFSWVRADDSDIITIADLDASTVRKATVGTGVFYFYNEGWNSELSFLLATPLTLSPGPSQTTLTLNRLTRFPCTGIITSSNEGYLIAPTVKIEVADGSDIAVILLSPRTFPHRLSLSKPSLSIPNEAANVVVSIDESELHCTGTVSGSNFDAARLIMNRNPNLPVYHSGYNQELCKLTKPGEMNVTWKPVSRIFDESLLVFYPSSIGADAFDQVLRRLGAPEKDEFSDAQTDTVVGDGAFTNYKLRLVVDKRFRRSLSDETSLTVT